MSPNMNLDALIAQKIGELTILSAKQSVMIDVLKTELAAKTAEIARLKAAEPELPLAAKNGANGHDKTAH